MNELERRALMGDADAQKECTEKGIVLPCPFCGDKADFFKLKEDWLDIGYSSTGFQFVCKNCKFGTQFSKNKNEALKDWNTRSAPPIGRCGECQKWGNKDCMYNGATFSNDYCSYFEPKQN